MKPFLKISTVAAISALMLATPALADGDRCSDCQDHYDKRLSACNETAPNSEAHDLCFSRANANRDACAQTCSYSGRGDDDRDNDKH